MRFTIKQSVDLELAPPPAQRVDGSKRVGSVACIAADHRGASFEPIVRVGERVHLGQHVMRDAQRPRLCLAAPGTGTVRDLRSGPRGALQALVIELEDPQVQEIRAGRPPSSSRAGVVDALLETGLWSALRERPFGRMPDPAHRPRSVFVTAIDTEPFAPDPAVVLATAGDDFERGARLLTELTDGDVHVCRAAGADIPVQASERVLVHEFDGPHPAGLVGTHIHFIDPVGRGRMVWHVGYSDVAAMGRLARAGELSSERVIALAGPGVERPRLVRTRLGASVRELLEGELRAGAQRVLSGSVLDGRQATSWGAHLGRFHRQIAVVPEPRDGRVPVVSTALHGTRTALLPLGVYERLVPLDLLVAPLLRALLVGDATAAEALGCLELEEEDLALCTYACPSKIDHGATLRAMLDRLEVSP